MQKFWDIVNKVIQESDLLLEVLDARNPEATRNIEIENKIKAKKKILIYVLNKCDLIGKETAENEKKKYFPSVFVSSTKRFGITKLLRTILRYSDKSKEKIIVGVLGYPNTGKSSVINALKGRASASVSPESGHTKAMQLIKVTKRVYLIDTPGVFPYKEKDEIKHALIASVDYTKISDPEMVALNLIEKMPEKIAEFYGINKGSSEEMLESIAFKLNHITKGNKPDTTRTARTIIKDWQRGKIKP